MSNTCNSCHTSISNDRQSCQACQDRLLQNIDSAFHPFANEALLEGKIIIEPQDSGVHLSIVCSNASTAQYRRLLPEGFRRLTASESLDAAGHLSSGLILQHDALNTRISFRSDEFMGLNIEAAFHCDTESHTQLAPQCKACKEYYSEDCPPSAQFANICNECGTILAHDLEIFSQIVALVDTPPPISERTETQVVHSGEWDSSRLSNPYFKDITPPDEADLCKTFFNAEAQMMGFGELGPECRDFILEIRPNPPLFIFPTESQVAAQQKAQTAFQAEVQAQLQSLPTSLHPLVQKLCEEGPQHIVALMNLEGHFECSVEHISISPESVSACLPENFFSVETAEPQFLEWHSEQDCASLFLVTNTQKEILYAVFIRYPNTEDFESYRQQRALLEVFPFEECPKCQAAVHPTEMHDATQCRPCFQLQKDTGRWLGQHPCLDEHGQGILEILGEHSLLLQHRTENQQHHSQWIRLNQASEALWAHCRAHFFTLRHTRPDKNSHLRKTGHFLSPNGKVKICFTQSKIEVSFSNAPLL